MKVKLNDKEYEISEGTTLKAFIENLGLKSQGIAIAINNEVVSKNMWSETILESNIEIMLIHAVSGG